MVVLLADEGFTGFHGLSLALLVGAVAAAAAWIVIFGWRWLATRPQMPHAGLETREVGPESPAIVNLLVNRWNVTRSAIQATLLDLASRKYIGIDQYGQEQFIVSLRNNPPDSERTEYERQVLDLIRKRATGGSAPAEAITLGEEGEAEAWWQRFRKSVAEDARKQRLARNRWAPLDWAILGIGLAVVFGLFALAFGIAHIGGRNSSGENSLDLTDWLGIGLFAWIVAMALLSRLRDLRDTPSGREACGRWLGETNWYGCRRHYGGPCCFSVGCRGRSFGACRSESRNGIRWPDRSRRLRLRRHADCGRQFPALSDSGSRPSSGGRRDDAVTHHRKRP